MKLCAVRQMIIIYIFIGITPPTDRDITKVKIKYSSRPSHYSKGGRV